ncbi:MAG: tRNA pseudouridine(55) synthase TruB [Dehalococcoidia bacterium]
MADGILNINKPVGVASFAVVRRVKRLTGVKRVGHAGTLDPIAGGVLPICLGRATRIVEYLVGQPKTYHASARFGEATDTHDSEGKVVATAELDDLTRERVVAALPGFVGEIQQLPPMYSALKYKGQPLYSYARAGKEVPREERTVSVYRLEMRRFEPPEMELEMECGRGAYVRTLVHDLGQALGCGAHMTGLTRLQSGPFTLKDAIDLETLEAAVESGAWEYLLQPVDRVLETWEAALLDEAHSRDVRQGRLVALAPVRDEVLNTPPETPCRAYSLDGDFLAILSSRGAGRWQPERVFVPQ